jgi:hypothetical protein
MSADHFVTVEWSWSSPFPRESLTCKAPVESICHAVWDCQCESWDADGIEDGAPWHSLQGGDFDSTERHVGRFDRSECNLVNWFDNTDEVMRGSITFPVVAAFDGDYYTFTPERAS